MRQNERNAPGISLRTRASVHYSEFDPSPPLAGQVSCYWRVEVGEVAPGHRHQVIPDGCVGLVASRSAGGGAWLTVQGPRLDALWVPIAAGDSFWGVRFWPDTGAAILRRDARALFGVLDRAHTALGPVADVLANALATAGDEGEARERWEEHLTPLIQASRPPDPAVRAAVLAIVAARGSAPIGELAAAVHLSPRQLQRRFSAAVGLSPKQFARVRRLREALLHLVEGTNRSWSAVAAELGFADQAHLIREFRSLAGLPPGEVAERIRLIGHGQVRP